MIRLVVSIIGYALLAIRVRHRARHMTPRRPAVPASVMAERLVVARGLEAFLAATGTSGRDLARVAQRSETLVRRWRSAETALPSEVFSMLTEHHSVLLQHYIRQARIESRIAADAARAA